MRRSLLMVLTMMALGGMLASCGDDNKPGSTCPLVDDQGPQILPGVPYLFVANSLGEDYVAAALTEEGFTPLAERGLTGQAPNDMDVVETKLYIVNSLDNNLSVVDLLSGRTEACIALGDNVSPWEFAPDPANLDRAWVSGWVSGELIELDLPRKRVIRRVNAGPGAEGVVVTDDRVAVTLSGYDGAENVYKNGSVVVFDKATLSEVARLAVPPNAQFIFDAADGSHHVVCTGNYVDVFGQVVRIEPDWSAVRDTLALGGSPGRATVTAGGQTVADGIAFLPSYFGGILAYDTVGFTVIHDVNDPLRAELGYTALFSLWDALYAANFETDKVVEIDPSTGAIRREFIAGDGPAVLAVATLPIL